MDVFTEIPDTLAIISLPKGVVKQVKLYHRGKSIYIPYSGGYVEVRYPQNSNGVAPFVTSHPNIRLTDFDGMTFPWHSDDRNMLRYGRGQ